MRSPETGPELEKNRPELTPDTEKKEIWLRNLAEFIVEANQNTWAADSGEVSPERPGYKELGYESGDWRLRDSYTGYFSAPGMTTIYYKDKPAWTMTYGGTGMEKDMYDITKPTFNFLKEALMKVTTDLPFRGPKDFKHKDHKGYKYQFKVNGDIEDFSGMEKITKDKKLAFSQIIFGGVVIAKDSSRQPIYPWDL